MVDIRIIQHGVATVQKGARRIGFCFGKNVDDIWVNAG